MAGTTIHDNNYHMYVTAGLTTLPTLNDFITDITSVGAIGGSRAETDSTTFSTVGKDKSLGTIDNGTFDVSGNQTEQQYEYFMNLLNLNKKVAVWIVIYDDDKNPMLYQRCAAQVSQVQSGDQSVDGMVTWTVTFTVSGIVYFSQFVDPMGPTAGKPITKLTVAGFAGATSIDTAGGTLTMTCDIEPLDASNPSYSFTVNDDSIAVINAGGRLMAKANGEVEVTAHAEDGSNITGKTTITITNQAS